MNQLNFALGLSKLPGHEKFIENVFESFHHLNQTSFESVLIFIIFLFGIIVTEKYRKNIQIISHIPATALFAVFGIFLGFLAASGVLPLSIQTLDSRYSDLTPALFMLPKFTFSFDRSFLSALFTVSLIAIIETMLSARIADSMTKTKHNKRKEMLGLGLANIASGIAGGIPATAALARTSLNIKSGATDKMSGVISSISVAVIALFLLPYFKYLPLTVIAAILVTVAVRMIEKEHFIRMFHIDKKSFFIALLVALITIVEDPIIGILVGATISLVLFLENLSHGQFELVANNAKNKMVGQLSGSRIDKIIKDSHTIVYSFKGHLTYIDSQAHIARFETDHDYHKNIILRLRELSFIDVDGVNAFEEIIEILERRKIEIYVTGVNDIIDQMLQKSKHFVSLEKRGRVFPRTSDALKKLGFKL